MCCDCFLPNHVPAVNPHVALCSVWCLTDIAAAQYMTELYKSHGGELIQTAAANIEDVNVAAARCQPLFVLLSCCRGGLQESLSKVCLGLFGAVWGRLGLFGAVWVCLELFGCVWGRLELFGAVWSRLGLFGAVWVCLGVFGAVRVCLGLQHTTAELLFARNSVIYTCIYICMYIYTYSAV
jgi:hypothetical protein